MNSSILLYAKIGLYFFCLLIWSGSTSVAHRELIDYFVMMIAGYYLLLFVPIMFMAQDAKIRRLYFATNKKNNSGDEGQGDEG